MVPRSLSPQRDHGSRPGVQHPDRQMTASFVAQGSTPGSFALGPPSSTKVTPPTRSSRCGERLPSSPLRPVRGGYGNPALLIARTPSFSEVCYVAEQSARSFQLH